MELLCARGSLQSQLHPAVARILPLAGALPRGADGLGRPGGEEPPNAAALTARHPAQQEAAKAAIWRAEMATCRGAGSARPLASCTGCIKACAGHLMAVLWLMRHVGGGRFCQAASAGCCIPAGPSLQVQAAQLHQLANAARQLPEASTPAQVQAAQTTQTCEPRANAVRQLILQAAAPLLVQAHSAVSWWMLSGSCRLSHPPMSPMRSQATTAPKAALRRPQ